MKKRIEKVVERTESIDCLTIGKEYLVYSETKNYYSIMDDEGDIGVFHKEKFKVVSEKEVLEFDGFNLDVFGKNQYSLEVISEIDLWNYDLKVIATPKDKTYEDMSKEELIKILKSK